MRLATPSAQTHIAAAAAPPSQKAPDPSTGTTSSTLAAWSGYLSTPARLVWFIPSPEYICTYFEVHGS